MATIHPAAIIRRKRIEKFPAMGYRPIPALDLRRLLVAARRGRSLASLDVRCELPPHSVFGGGFAFDLETDAGGKPSWIGVQALAGGPVYGAGWEDFKGRYGETFAGAETKAGHNICGADIQWLEDEGVAVDEPFDDTMALGGLCEPDMARGLYYQAALYLGHERPFWKELWGAHRPFEVRRQTALRAAWIATGLVPEWVYGEFDWRNFYNALDVDSTRRVYLAQMKRCAEEGWV